MFENDLAAIWSCVLIAALVRAWLLVWDAAELCLQTVSQRHPFVEIFAAHCIWHACLLWCVCLLW